MNIDTIVAYVFLGLMLWGIAMFGIKSWQHRNETHDVDLQSLGKITGPGGLVDPGDPEMISRIEKKLKKAPKNK